MFDISPPPFYNWPTYLKDRDLSEFKEQSPRGEKLERIDTNKALKVRGKYLQVAKGSPLGKDWIEDVLRIKEDSKSSPS